MLMNMCIVAYSDVDRCLKFELKLNKKMLIIKN